MALHDMVQVLQYGCLLLEGEELLLSLEIAELKNEIRRHHGLTACSGSVLDSRQVEIETAVVGCEAGQAIQIFDFAGGENFETMGTIGIWEHAETITCRTRPTMGRRRGFKWLPINRLRGNEHFWALGENSLVLGNSNYERLATAPPVFRSSTPGSRGC